MIGDAIAVIFLVIFLAAVDGMAAVLWSLRGLSAALDQIAPDAYED